MHPFRGAFCGTLGVLAAIGVVFLGVRAAQVTLGLASLLLDADSLEDDRCQPIGCDSGIHRPGCKYEERDSASVD
jgi:hypothetical protein